jgi:purine nucleosidase
MNIPTISNADRFQKLQSPEGKVRMVLDTDTYNEIDDQFAVVHALLSQNRLWVVGGYEG